MPKFNPLKCSIPEAIALWEEYTEWQRGQLAPSTIAKDYKKFGVRIAKIPKSLTNAADCAAWLRQNFSTETARRTLQQLGACYAWAVGLGKADRNPWASLPKIRATKGDSRYRAFTPADQKAILKAFRTHHPEFSPWVEFLFGVGCRPSEAAALLWGKVSADCSHITIDAAIPCDTRCPQGTKTHASRSFRCPQKIQALLKRLRPPHPSPGAIVFPNASGGYFHFQNFQRDYWRPLVQGLHEAGEISIYLPQKNCRHTRATTLSRAGLSPTDASSLLGNTPAVYLASYVEQSRNLVMPE
jgi:integrase